MIFMSENITTLKSLPLWIGTKMENNKLMFIDPNNGNEDTEYNVSECVTYEQAMEAMKKYKFDDVSFILSDDYFILYVSNIYNDDKSVKDYVREIIDNVNSYTEYGPNGNDISIIFKSNVNDKTSIQRNPYYDNNMISIANNGHIKLTFKPYESEKPINSHSDEFIENIINKYFYCGLDWRQFGSHYKCDIDNDISLWLISQGDKKYTPFVTNVHYTTWVKIMATTGYASEICIKWRDELAQYNYNMEEWRKARSEQKNKLPASSETKESETATS